MSTQKRIYTEGVYKNLPYSTSQTWLADFYVDKARKLGKKYAQQQALVDSFEPELEGANSQQNYEILFSMLDNKYINCPLPIVTPDKKQPLHDALDKFLHIAYDKNTINDPNLDAQYLIYWLIKNMTSSDANNVVDYVKRYTDFTQDTTFDHFRKPVQLGKIDTKRFCTMNVNEYEKGLETPSLFLFWVEDQGEKVVLPFIRYGIENKIVVGKNGEEKVIKTAFIYAMQRRENEDSALNQELNHIFAGANSGVKHNRNAIPSMMCVLSAFLGILNQHGVTRIQAPDFIPRRYGTFWQSKTEESDTRIQSNVTDRFMVHFLRLAQQFDGVDITALPNDIDSFIHLSLQGDISTTNSTLQKFYDMGKMVIPENQNKKLSLPTQLMPPQENAQNVDNSSNSR